MPDSLISLYKPAHQLVIYKSPNSAYVEHYEIINNKLSEGRPLTKKALKEMLDAVMTSDRSVFATVNQLIPENVIYYDPRPGRLRLIWYNKPKERVIHGIYKRESKIKLPAILYYLKEDKLSIYTMKTGNKRPQLKTPLYHAPLPNLYKEGNVCMGNVKKPSNQIEIADLINAWETAFWRSEFTDFLWDKDGDKPLKACIRSKQMFPLKSLKPIKTTISNLIK
jgi:PRTRC genetic system protein B